MFENVDQLVAALTQHGAATRGGWRGERLVILDAIIETGGADGGNCWGGDARSYSTGKSFGEESAIADMLEVLYPDISFLRYRRLRAEVLSEQTFSENEYYGNHTEYLGRVINIDRLFEILQDEKP